jgi:predicted  nucleic acid-binding Zn-ribbon protein
VTKAPAEDQIRLLDVQFLDTRLAQLAHRRRSLPEHAQLAELATRADALADELVSASTSVGDIARELRKAEDDVELVRGRAARDNARLQSGQGSAKDLQALQHELVSLGRRQSALEDVELEVMERAEQAQAEQSRIETEVERMEAARAQLVARLEEQTREIDAEVARVSADREQGVSGLDQALVTLYEKVRAGSGGLGAAPLKARRCEGCRLELTPVDLGRIRTAADDEVLRCEECRRILVRLPESGL